MDAVHQLIIFFPRLSLIESLLIVLYMLIFAVKEPEFTVYGLLCK